MINNRIKELKEGGNLTWEQLAEIVNDEFDLELSGNACRKRYNRMSPDVSKPVKIVNNSEPDVPDGYELVPQSVWEVGDSWQRSYKIVPKSVSVADYENIVNHLNNINLNVNTPTEKKGELAIFSTYDLHIGKGSADFLLADYKFAIEKLLTRLRKEGVAKILWPLGNDFCHYDNPRYTTTAGTPQETRMDWQDMVNLSAELAVWTVNAMLGVADVDVLLVPGNHDRYSDQWLINIIKYAFPENVHVDADKNPRKYYRFGESAFMFTHGDQEKPASYMGLFAVEAGDYFVNATRREVYTGHLHKQAKGYQMINEEHGLIVRTIPSLNSHSDNWHGLKGYIGNAAKAICHVYDEYGQVAEFYA